MSNRRGCSGTTRQMAGKCEKSLLRVHLSVKVWRRRNTAETIGLYMAGCLWCAARCATSQTTYTFQYTFSLLANMYTTSCLHSQHADCNTQANTLHFPLVTNDAPTYAPTILSSQPRMEHSTASPHRACMVVTQTDPHGATTAASVRCSRKYTVVSPSSSGASSRTCS